MKRWGMPCKAISPMDERMRFVAAFLEGECSMAELCRRCSISRKTGYKWMHRYFVDGPEGLGERSHRPHSNSRGVAEEVVELIPSVVPRSTAPPEQNRSTVDSDGYGKRGQAKSA